MNISENIMLGSGNKVSLLLPEQQIKDTLNGGLKQFYGDLVKVKRIEELSSCSIRIFIERSLPSDYLMAGFVSYIDSSIITGLSEKCFIPGPEQIVFPIIPFGRAFFSPENEVEKIYKTQLSIMAGAHVRSINVKATMADLIVEIKFVDNNGAPQKYIADIKALTQNYGDLNLLQGQTMRCTLSELAKLCPRPQVKMDAYKGLTNYLKKSYGISLCISSNKTKTDSIR